MDGVIAVLIALLVVSTTWSAVESRKTRESLRKLHTTAMATQGMLHARQAAIRFDRTTRQAPGVDAQGRITRPIRHDIPAEGGTIRKLKTKKVGGDAPDQPGTD